MNGNNKNLPAVRTDMQDIETARVFAEIAMKAGCFPQLKNPAQAILKVLAGREYGFGPFISLKNVFFVGDTPALSGGAIASKIKESGTWDYLPVELSDKGCSLQFYKNGEKWGEVICFLETDATQAGLLNGKNVNWTKYPQAMYFNRALTKGARIHCPHLFNGCCYTQEELRSGMDSPELIVNAPEGSDVASQSIMSVVDEPPTDWSDSDPSGPPERDYPVTAGPPIPDDGYEEWLAGLAKSTNPQPVPMDNYRGNPRDVVTSNGFQPNEGYGASQGDLGKTTLNVGKFKGQTFEAVPKNNLWGILKNHNNLGHSAQTIGLLKSYFVQKGWDIPDPSPRENKSANF